MVGRNEFEIANREFVKPHETLLFDAGDAGDVFDVVVLRLVEIRQDRSRRRDRRVQVVHAEALEIFHLKMFQHLGARRAFGKSPVVEFENEIASRKQLFEFPFLSALNEHLFRGKARQQFVDVLRVAFGHQVFARRNIEQRKSHIGRAEMHGSQKVVFPAREHIVSQRHPRCHQFGDASFHQFLGQFRVFELVADGHSISCPDQPRQVVVERMVRKTGHFCRGICPLLVAFRQGDPQHLRGRDGISAIRFVEVAAAKQQNRIGVGRFHVMKLPHHRSEFVFGHRRKK